MPEPLISKAPEKPEQVFPEFVSDMQALFKENLVSVVLYGSAASGEYKRGISDLNFLIVLKQFNPAELEQIYSVVDAWRSRKVTAPLFLTAEELENMSDVFPVEFLDIKENHKTVCGEDILKKIKINPKNLRRQLEFEFSSRLIKLRESYFELSGSKAGLRKLLVSPVSTLLPLFKGMLYLKKVKIPKRRDEIVDAVEKYYKVELEVLHTAVKLKREEINLYDDEIRENIGRLVSLLSELSSIVNAMKV